MVTLFVDRLTVADFSYLDRRRGLLGESWIVDIGLAGQLDEQGMVLDFGEAKKRIKAWIDDHVDHRLLVPADSEDVSLSFSSDAHRLEFSSSAGLIVHEGPNESLCRVPGSAVSTESVARWMEQALRPVLPASVLEVSVSLRVPEWSEPYYHYSHGLQQHGGNCQRIAHGHRSPIRIWVDGQLDTGWMRRWAERFQDIYLASSNHLRRRHGELVELAYDAPQGHFRLMLPEERVYWLDTPTTVEWIASHMAARTAAETGLPVKVQAFEGVDKGAIAYG
jgi:6-pyruvoyl-tetrahydropterin synthase